MNLISENSSILITIIIATNSLILYFSYNFKKLKTTEKNRLNTVFLEIEYERKTQLSLKNVPKQLNALELKTEATFKKVNITIFNIDFSYKEVVSNI